jgi:hypothetical protein
MGAGVHQRKKGGTMESDNRNVWIIVAVVLVIACCCAAVVIVAVAAWLTGGAFDWGGVAGYETESIERTFEVGRAPSLEIDNFAGSVTVRPGEDDTIHVVATKRARSKSLLERIEVDMDERGDGLVIKTDRPRTLSSASVKLEITAPAGTDLDAHTGSGSIDVEGLSGDVKLDTGSGSVDARDLSGDLEVDTGSGSVDLIDVTGEIDVHTGSGSIEVQGGTGLVRLDTGSGSIEYQGTPEGDCRFETGSGRIRLTLPADLNMEVDLDTGSGDIDVEFDVAGRVTRRDVDGKIGDGSQGSIYGHTGSGSIDLIRR